MQYLLCPTLARPSAEVQKIGLFLITMAWITIILLTNAKLKENSMETHFHLLQSLRNRKNL